MKLKYILSIICLIAIILLSLTYIYVNNEREFIDAGTSFDNNNKWINKNLNVTRDNNFTTLSSNSDTPAWLMADYKINGDCCIEWDNYGNRSYSDYCLLSDIEKTKDTPLNFDNLHITNGCHVKLIIKDNKIVPYINETMNNPVSLKTNAKDGLLFRFQINTNGSDIKYNNFKISSI